MLGRSPSEAVYEYIVPLKRALSCITRDVLVNKGGTYPSPKPHLLTTSGDGRIDLGGKLYLAIIQQYSVIQLEAGEDWKVRTAYYSYGLEDESNELLVYHWHPEGPSRVTYPHLHLEAGARVGRPELPGSHIPTGRIALEDFILYLIETFNVKPLREDWRAVLDETGSAFRRHKSW